MIKKIATFGLLAIMITAPSFAQKMKPVQQNYGNNLIRFSPISALDIGVGFGVSYERLLGAEKIVGVILPVHLILEDNGNWNNNNNTNYNSYFYFTPGIKVYPFGQRRITYAVGPSLMLGYGGGKDWNTSPDPWGGQELVNKTVFRLGMLVNNYINFQLTQNFNIGLEAGLGMKYIDNTKYSSSFQSWTEKEGFDVTGEFQLTLGYRF